MSAWHTRYLWIGMVVLAGCHLGCQHIGSWLPNGAGDPLLKSAAAKSGEPDVAQASSGAPGTNPAPAFESARTLERSGKLEEALTAYRRIIADTPDDGLAHHRLAVLCDRLQRGNESEQHFRTALRLLPNDPEIRCDYAYSLYLRKRYPQAESELRQALSTNPDHGRSHLHLGLVLAQLDRKNEAYASFVAAGCTPAESHANIAYALMSQSRWQDAAESLRLASQADPQSALVQSRYSEVNQILAQLPANASKGQVEVAGPPRTDPNLVPAAFHAE